jgi:NAD(P)-dependent dehydrogenase (short-subunit alcohol dehydrogenase family)
VARKLASAGYRVLVHGRNRERGDSLVGQIISAGGAAVFYQADLASLAAVRALATDVQKSHPRLHLLINNAGIGTGGRATARASSVDGYELRFAVNYLAGFLLTRLLLPSLVAATPARIVNIASAAQFPIDFGNVMLTRAYSGLRAYAQSKLAQIMFTFDLARELEGSGVTVNCLHPATYMDTAMVREAGATPASTVEQGAEAVMRLATAPELETQTGLYFDGQHPARAQAQAYDAAAREQLAALSAELVRASAPTV